MESRQKREARNRLIEEHRQFVSVVAGQVVRSLRLPAELFEECVAAGYLGLVEAARRFDESGSVKFKNFAYLRVRGAIIDCLRRCSPVPFHAYRLLKALEAVQQLQEIRNARGRRLTAAAEKRLGDLLDETSQVAMAYRLSLHECDPAICEMSNPTLSPEDVVQKRQEHQLFERLFAALPEKEGLIMRLYYFEGKTFKQIAEVCGGMTSKSWVCRLHARAVERVRKMYMEEEARC